MLQSVFDFNPCILGNKIASALPHYKKNNNNNVARTFQLTKWQPRDGRVNFPSGWTALLVLLLIWWDKGLVQAWILSPQTPTHLAQISEIFILSLARSGERRFPLKSTAVSIKTSSTFQLCPFNYILYWAVTGTMKEVFVGDCTFLFSCGAYLSDSKIL